MDDVVAVVRTEAAFCCVTCGDGQFRDEAFQCLEEPGSEHFSRICHFMFASMSKCPCAKVIGFEEIATLAPREGIYRVHAFLYAYGRVSMN